MAPSDPHGSLGIGVLASGSGTILEAILESSLPVRLVVVDRPCRAQEVASEHGVPSERVDRAAFGGFGAGFDRTAYTIALTEVLQRHDVDVVVMAGFGTVLAEPVHTAYPGRILNTHPALLPAFPGWHGCARPWLPAWPRRAPRCTWPRWRWTPGRSWPRQAVPVRPGDTEESLHERIKEVERTLYPATIRRFVDGLAATPAHARGSGPEVKA